MAGCNNSQRLDKTPRRRDPDRADGGRTMRVLALAATFAAFASASPAAASPANTLHDLFVALRQCLASPQGPAGSALTIRFSLRRDGALLGKPQITFAKLSGDAAEQRGFIEGVAAAFDRCLPMAITDSLGGAIAGRPLSLRFLVRPRETKT